MTKTKSTKRALLSAVLALMLCVAMLVGTTYAWFTDSVTSGRNTIVSGNLDVELYYSALQADGTWSTYEKVTSTTKVFSETAQYEPGYTEVVKFKVVNEGSLALKYNLAAQVYSEIEGVNVANESFKLSNFLMTGLADVNAITDRDAAAALAVNKLGTFTMADQVSLAAGAEKEIAMVITMPTTVGNEANYKKSDDPADPTKYQPSIELGVTLVATQFTAESDSFGSDYDADAGYAIEVKTAAELANALSSGGLVKLVNDISVTETLTVPAGVAVELNLNGKTITAATTAIRNKGMLSINGGVIDVSGATAQGLQAVDSTGILTLNGGTYKGAKTLYSYAVRAAGSLTINAADVEGGFGGVAVQAGATAVINGGKFTNSMDEGAHCLIAWSDSNVTVNGGEFIGHTQTNAYSQYCAISIGTGKITINGGNFVAFTTSGGAKRMFSGNVTINAGTFDKDPTAYANGQVVDNGNGTWTVKPFEVSTANDMATKLAEGKPVVLTDDVAFTSQLSITKDAYIDAKGNTIKFTSGSSTRFIDVPKEAVGADLTIKNAVIDIDGSYCQRGINYNTNGTLTLEKVTLKGTTKATYGINLPSGSANATVDIVDCDITALIALNVWGENVVVNVKDSNLSNYDNNATEGENYVTVMLNNNGTDSAEGAVITITGGTITAKDETGALCIAIKNNTATGAIVVSDTTVVKGITATNVAAVRYKDGNGNFYNESYGSTTLQSAVTLAAKSANAEVFLLTDITVDTLDVPANVILHKNGHELEIGATTGSGTLTVVD